MNTKEATQALFAVGKALTEYPNVKGSEAREWGKMIDIIQAVIDHLVELQKPEGQESAVNDKQQDADNPSL